MFQLLIIQYTVYIYMRTTLYTSPTHCARTYHDKLSIVLVGNALGTAACSFLKLLQSQHIRSEYRVYSIYVVSKQLKLCSMHPPTYLSDLSIYLSIYRSIHPSIYLSICLSVCLSYFDFDRFCICIRHSLHFDYLTHLTPEQKANVQTRVSKLIHDGSQPLRTCGLPHLLEKVHAGAQARQVR